MPSLQQKSPKKGPKMYLLNGSNLILIILRFDDGSSSDHEMTFGGFLKTLG